MQLISGSSFRLSWMRVLRCMQNFMVVLAVLLRGGETMSDSSEASAWRRAVLFQPSEELLRERLRFARRAVHEDEHDFLGAAAALALEHGLAQAERGAAVFEAAQADLEIAGEAQLGFVIAFDAHDVEILVRAEHAERGVTRNRDPRRLEILQEDGVIDVIVVVDVAEADMLLEPELVAGPVGQIRLLGFIRQGYCTRSSTAAMPWPT